MFTLCINTLLQS